MVRLPVEVAEALVATAQDADRSLSDTAGDLIELGLRARSRGAA
jgi:hypothetical protein